MSRPSKFLQQVRTILAVACGRAVSALLRLHSTPAVRIAAARATLCVGVLVQVGLCLVTMYLIDLSISLMELWTHLARKHLELTL